MKRISIGSLIEENGLTEDSKILMPKNLADGEMTLLTSENGLSLYKVDIKAKEDFISESVFSKDMLSFSFLLQGSTYYRNNNLGFTKIFKENHLNMIALNGENAESIYKKGTQTTIYNLTATGNFLEEISNYGIKIENLLQQFQKGEFFKILKELPYDINTVETFNEIEKFQGNKNLKEIYLKGKCYSLLYNWLDRYEVDDVLPNKEIEYLDCVKNFILEHLEEDLSIKQLAKVGKTNENKLQQNFKKVFGVTVFGFILDKRMEKAKELLEIGEHSISQVAHFVGYRHQSNFTNAFFKKYGVLPKNVLKRQNYYI